MLRFLKISLVPLVIVGCGQFSTRENGSYRLKKITKETGIFRVENEDGHLFNWEDLEKHREKIISDIPVVGHTDVLGFDFCILHSVEDSCLAMFFNDKGKESLYKYTKINRRGFFAFKIEGEVIALPMIQNELETSFIRFSMEDSILAKVRPLMVKKNSISE